MTNDPVLVIGGATVNDPGETITGAAFDNTQTDSFAAYGYNNLIIEDGGNLDVVPAVAPVDLGLGLTATPYTTIELGNALDVTDNIALTGANDAVLQKPASTLINSVVVVTETEVFGAADTTVSLTNSGGTNEINLYEANNTVALIGAVNSVTTSGSSTIDLNGNASNNVSTASPGQSGPSTIDIGTALDHFFGYTTTALIAPGDTLTAGDENVLVGALPYSAGYDSVTLGYGNNMVTVLGLANRVVVGGGNNYIVAGSGLDSVTIRGVDGLNLPRSPRHPRAGDAPVPISPNDTIVLAGGDNTINATYENVTVAGTAASGYASLFLGNGSDTIDLGGDDNYIAVGNNTNAITLTGNDNRIFVTDARGRGEDAILLGAGTNDRVSLAKAGGQITNSGMGTTTVTQTLTSRAAVTVDLALGTGTVTLGNGADQIAAGGAGTTISVGNGANVITATGGSAAAPDTIDLGTGRNTVVVGAYTSVMASGGNDTIALGDDSQARVAGDVHSKASVALGNADVVGLTGGRITIQETTNDTVYSDGAAAGSTITLADKDDLVFFGSDGSAHVFLNPAGADLVGIRALAATGSYAGTIELTQFSGSVLELEGLNGGITGAALTSYSAVLQNTTVAGSREILQLQGGGEVIFAGRPPLQPGSFEFANLTGPVVPGNP